jgi:chaperonin GroES
MSVKFQPIGDKVLVKEHEVVEKTESGLFLAGHAVKKSALANVVAAGEGRDTIHGLVPLRVKAGDTVSIVPGTGIELTLNGEKFLILREHEILGITA